MQCSDASVDNPFDLRNCELPTRGHGGHLSLPKRVRDFAEHRCERQRKIGAVEHPLNLLVQREQDKPRIDASRGYAKPSSELRRCVSRLQQLPVGTGLLPGGMYLFECAEFVLKMWICRVDVNQKSPVSYQGSESRAP